MTSRQVVERARYMGEMIESALGMVGDARAREILGVVRHELLRLRDWELTTDPDPDAPAPAPLTLAALLDAMPAGSSITLTKGDR